MTRSISKGVNVSVPIVNRITASVLRETSSVRRNANVKIAKMGLSISMSSKDNNQWRVAGRVKEYRRNNYYSLDTL